MWLCFQRCCAALIADRIFGKFLLCIFSDFCNNPGICTVEHPEDGHRSDRNMQVVRIEDIYSRTTFVSVHLLVCA